MLTCGIFYCRDSAEINGCGSLKTASWLDSDMLRNRQQKHTAIRCDANWHVLDYGAGTGNLLLYILPKVAHITAMDNSDGMLTVLQSKIPTLYSHKVQLLKHHADTEELPKDAYNLIMSSMTLHHIQNTKEFIIQCYNALKPGGLLVLIDLCKEDGTFHKDLDSTIHHFGFDLEHVTEIFTSVRLKTITIHEFYAIYKEHVNKHFPVFFAIAQKQ